LCCGAWLVLLKEWWAVASTSKVGLRAGMPKADFKGEDMEAATRILKSPPLLVSYQYTVKFDKKFKTIEILTI
jgi:hypothetical protein